MKSKTKKHKHNNNLITECEYIEYILSSKFDDNSNKLQYYINDKKNLKKIIETIDTDYNMIKLNQEIREIENKNYNSLYRRYANQYTLKTAFKELCHSIIDKKLKIEA